MGNIRSKFVKPIRTFNIESRTEKFLEKEKPTPAPTFASVKRQLKAAEEASPNFLEEHAKKDAVLDDRLKEVYVSSQDKQTKHHESERPLPQSRSTSEPWEFGVYEPEVIPPGKCNMRQAITFLHQHKVDPIEHSLDKIAQEYKLNKQVVEDIVKHFHILHLKLPDPTTLDEPFLNLRQFHELTNTRDGRITRARAKEIMDEAKTANKTSGKKGIALEDKTKEEKK